MGSVASRGNRPAEYVIGSRRSVTRECHAPNGLIEILPRPDVTARYPNEQTWLVTAYVAAIANRSRTAFVKAGRRGPKLSWRRSKWSDTFRQVGEAMCQKPTADVTHQHRNEPTLPDMADE